MENIAYLDTHLVLWLYAGAINLIPERVKAILERSDILISPAVELELQFLYETGKIKQPAQIIITTLQNEIELKTCKREFAKISSLAGKMNWTGDVFDRLITAQAALGNNILLTGNETIRLNYPRGFWT